MKFYSIGTSLLFLALFSILSPNCLAPDILTLTPVGECLYIIPGPHISLANKLELELKILPV